MNRLNTPQSAPQRNQSMGELPPVNPVDPSYTPPPEQPQPHVPKPPKRIKIRYIILGILILLLVAAAGWWYMSVDHAADSSSNTTSEPQESRAPQPTEPLFTYIGSNSDQKQEVLVTNSTQKMLATLVQSEGKNRFTVLANNWDQILVEEYLFTNESLQDPAKNYFVINKAGESTKLSEAVASKLSAITLGRPYFAFNNALVYVGCDDDSCDLYNLSIESGDSASMYSLAYTPPEAPDQLNTLELLGVSWENEAYTITHDNGIDKPGTLRTIDVTTKKQVTEYPMAAKSLNTPDLSYDNSKLLYTDLADNKTIKVMETASGKTVDITPGIPAGPVYFWSFDNQTAAFSAEAGSEPEAKNTVQIGTVDTKASTVQSLISYGDRATNSIGLGGWSAGAILNYVHTTTTNPNNFVGGAQTIYSINSQDGSITTNPLPLGYILVSPQSGN